MVSTARQQCEGRLEIEDEAETETVSARMEDSGILDLECEYEVKSALGEENVKFGILRDTKLAKFGQVS
ncbi:hypothetical protein Sjap_022256 [Stephania japonica]|uniref:Uncharacterized protein n=1 Tax=Stephania japonica TaxID=461633 RepID=A0AAP0EXD5_9MAGN